MLIRPATAADAADIEMLLDTAFGPGRHARTASQLRADAAPIAGPSLVALGEGGELLGSIQYWPIRLEPLEARGAPGEKTTLTLLGPVAVDRSARAIGLGRRLIAASLAIADAHGLDPILLIGDHSYYGPFGFTAAATGDWQLPGPVERERLLLRQKVAMPLPGVARVVAAGVVSTVEEGVDAALAG